MMCIGDKIAKKSSYKADSTLKKELILALNHYEGYSSVVGFGQKKLESITVTFLLGEKTTAGRIT